MPAYVPTIDLGPLGRRISSAQVADHYSVETLVGRQVLCVCNFEPTRIMACADRAQGPA